MIKFKNCSFGEIKESVCKYYIENDILVDSFWEEHALESNYYNIELDNEVIGYCGIYNKSLITVFNVYKKYSYLATEIFIKVRHLEEVSEAFIPTGDELLLSLSLDNYMSIEKQAYFTRDLKVKVKMDKSINLKQASIYDKDIIEKYSEDFFDDIDKSIKLGCIYIARKDDEVLGFGNVELGIVRSDLASLGMFVRKDFREKGIGTNILFGLKEIVNMKGREGISGCWYYNHNSLKTQFNSGNYCSTRLLRIKF